MNSELEAVDFEIQHAVSNLRVVQNQIDQYENEIRKLGLVEKAYEDSIEVLKLRREVVKEREQLIKREGVVIMKSNYEEALKNTIDSMDEVAEQTLELGKFIETSKRRLKDLECNINSMESDIDDMERDLQDKYNLLGEVGIDGDDEVYNELQYDELQYDIFNLESVIFNFRDDLEDAEIEYEELEDEIQELEQELIYLDEEYAGLSKDFQIYNSAIEKEKK